MPNGPRRQPEQLKMFMTPAEIHAQYQPLDGDREDRDVYAAREGKSNSQFTDRSHNTAGDVNYKIQADNSWARKHAGGKTRYATVGAETDTELWDRKLSEAQMSKADYDEMARGEINPPEFTGGWSRTGAPQHETGHTGTFEAREASWQDARERSHQAKEDEYYYGASLHDSVAKEGVQYPLHLGTSIGSQGKPQIAGGHHRLAAQTNINPDQFIPVIHHEGSTGEARASAKRGGYEYR